MKLTYAKIQVGILVLTVPMSVFWFFFVVPSIGVPFGIASVVGGLAALAMVHVCRENIGRIDLDTEE